MNAFTLFSTSGNCKDYDQKSKNRKRKEIKSQPLINLGLGIRGSTFCNTNTRKFSDDSEKDNSFVISVKEEVNEGEVDDHDHDSDYDDHVVDREGCRKCSVVRLTEEQVEELKRQLIIFKYIVWGLPVPFQLLLPIWRGFSSSCVLHHKGSSSISLASFSENLNYLHMMDPEPGRCRRTDGKKWRCQQSVIPNEKYCQKHMHRGSKRSRKLVEASPSPIRCKFPANVDNKVGPTTVMITTPGLTNSLAKTNENGEQKKIDISCEIPEKLDKVGRTTVVMRTSGLNDTIVKCNVNVKPSDGAENGVAKNEKITVVKLASGLDFSPKSVLQNGMGMSYTTSQAQKSISESETRCRRTDGKKWRCKKKVTPNYKYCPQHLSRRKVQTGGPSLGPSTFIEAQTSYAYTSIAKISRTEQGKTGSELGVDTNLKISLPRNFNKDSVAQQGGGSTNSSEATESDEDSTGIFDVITLSPSVSEGDFMD